MNSALLVHNDADHPQNLGNSPVDQTLQTHMSIDVRSWPAQVKALTSLLCVQVWRHFTTRRDQHGEQDSPLLILRPVQRGPARRLWVHRHTSHVNQKGLLLLLIWPCFCPPLRPSSLSPFHRSARAAQTAESKRERQEEQERGDFVASRWGAPPFMFSTHPSLWRSALS